MPRTALEVDRAKLATSPPGPMHGQGVSGERPADHGSKALPQSSRHDTVAAVAANGLSKRFGNTLVLDGIDLELRQGEILALTGPNGSGKTTLLRCLAGAYRPTSGQVLWFGRPVGRDASLHRLVGLVDHDSLLYRNLTVAENLLFAARMYGLADPRGRVQQQLESTGLRPFAHRPAGQVSQGMGRRLSIARALVHDPSIVLMDEPFAGLDVAGSDWLVRLLRALRARGRAICCITHDRDKVGELADRVVQLQSGRLRELEPNAWDRSFGG